MQYENPPLTIDIVLLSLAQGDLHVALLRQAQGGGELALPGQEVLPSEESANDALALKVIQTKLGLVPRHLEQVCTVTGRGRGPDSWSASVVYLALHPMADLQKLAAAGVLELFPVALLPALVADHAELVRTAVKRLKAKAAYTTVVAHFLGLGFTLTELHGAFESVLGVTINQANFRHKILELAVLKPAGTRRGVGRPAALYRLKRDLAYFDRALA